MIPLILDCDNTMGLPGCDVDDGTALLYLLGSPEVNLLGISCAYGNSTQERVYENTRRLLKRWKREDIPLFRGCEGPGQTEAPAVDLLVDMAKKYKGELRLLVLGSTTNLAAAAKKFPAFWDSLHSVTLMGGVTEALLVGGKPMEELNLSIDWPSSLQLLRHGPRLSIACAQHCLDSYFSEADFLRELSAHPGPVADMLRAEILPWFTHNREHWDLDGFVNWDVMAAAMLLAPELFDAAEGFLSPAEDSPLRGLLLSDGPAVPARLPRIRNREAYVRHVYERIFAARIFPE